MAEPFGVQLEVADFERKLAERLLRLHHNADNENARVADVAAERMRALAEPHVESGETLSSIKVEHGEGGSTISAGGAARYDEFGTSDMPPIPFMRPALAEIPGEYKPPTTH